MNEICDISNSDYLACRGQCMFSNTRISKFAEKENIIFYRLQSIIQLVKWSNEICDTSSEKKWVSNSFHY